MHAWSCDTEKQRQTCTPVRMHDNVNETSIVPNFVSWFRLYEGIKIERKGDLEQFSRVVPEQEQACA